MLGEIIMELVKNIFFNTDKLTQNNKVKISYTGTFFQDDSQEVFAHFGFGLNWNNITEIKMEKTELGFQAEIELPESDSLNLCFRNEKKDWDNNLGENYIFPIERVETDLLVIDDLSTSLKSVRRLRKGYLLSKKIRLAIYKAITALPKLISGTYRKKAVNDIEE